MNDQDTRQHLPGSRPEHTLGTIADPSLDRVLGALQQVEPRDGFHERLLAGLERAADEPSTRGRFMGSWRPLLSSPRLALGAFALGALLLPVLLVPRLSHHEGVSSPRSEAHPVTTPADVAGTPATIPETPVTYSLGITNRARLNNASTSNPADRELAPPAASMPPPVVLTGSVLPTQAALDSQALDDLSTQSQPAPYNGPTGQEQAVRHILERDGSAQLAELELTRDPARRAQERAAFHQFFEPKPIKKDEASSPDPAQAESPGKP